MALGRRFVLKYTATVYPEKVVAQMSVDRMDEQYEDDPLEQTITEDVDEARDWLRSQ